MGHGCGSSLLLLAVFSFLVGPWVTFSWNWFGQETVRTYESQSNGARDHSLSGLSCSFLPYKFEFHHTDATGASLPGNKNGTRRTPPGSLLPLSPFERESQNVLILVNQHNLMGFAVDCSFCFFSSKSDSLIKNKYLFHKYIFLPFFFLNTSSFKSSCEFSFLVFVFF